MHLIQPHHWQTGLKVYTAHGGFMAPGPLHSLILWGASLSSHPLYLEATPHSAPALGPGREGERG